METLLTHTSPTVLVSDRAIGLPSRNAPRNTCTFVDATRLLSDAPEAGGNTGEDYRLANHEDTFVVLYTSGTTAIPRGVSRDYATCARWWSFLAAHNRCSPATVTAIASPVYTAMTIGTVLPTLFAGGTCVFCEQFDAQAFLELSKRVMPSFCALSATHWALLLADSAFAPGALRSYVRMVSGGCRLEERLKADLMSLFPDTFFELYGTSESGAITELSAQSPVAKRGSVGLPLADVDIRIVDGAGKVTTEEGEVVVRTSRMMSGYYNDAERTAEARWCDPTSGTAFCRTGDIGRRCSDGYLWLMGRSNDVIITAGFNIYPSDIEDVLVRHRDIVEAAVVSEKHDVLGETPVAFVVIREGSALTASDLCQWVNGRLSKNQQIYEVRVVDSIPKDHSGKALKRLLRQ